MHNSIFNFCLPTRPKLLCSQGKNGKFFKYSHFCYSTLGNPLFPVILPRTAKVHETVEYLGKGLGYHKITSVATIRAHRNWGLIFQIHLAVSSFHPSLRFLMSIQTIWDRPKQALLVRPRVSMGKTFLRNFRFPDKLFGIIAFLFS